MVKAVWQGTVIAESDDTVIVDGNHYFPSDSLVQEHFRSSANTSVCPWKGTANYYDITVGDAVNEGAAWYYSTPKPKAEELKDRVAFWRGVTVS
ncbi:MAG: DUF427 domain-containing protein [Planctomycetota bacterium]